MNELSSIYKGYEAKCIVVNIGHDLAGWNMTLYKDGVKIAIVDNDGCGGCVDFHWLSDDAEKTFYAFIEQERQERQKTFVPKDEYDQKFGLVFDDEIFVSDLIDKALIIKDLKKECKKGICYQLKEQIGTSKFFIIQGNYTYKGHEEKFNTWAEKHHPNQELLVLNAELGVN